VLASHIKIVYDLPLALDNILPRNLTMRSHLKTKTIAVNSRTAVTYLSLAIIVAVLGACRAMATPEATPSPTPTLPAPEAYTTQVPEVEAVVRSFLNNWRKGDYAAMYAMLASDSSTAISEEQFIQRYTDVDNEAALLDLEYQVFSGQISPREAEVPYELTLKSAVVDDINREMVMNLIMEGGQWRIVWSDGLILPELANGNYLLLDQDAQPRAGIYDRYGNPLAAQQEAAAIGVWADYVDLEDSQGLLSLLSSLTNYKSHTIISKIQDSWPGTYLALGEIPVDQDPRRLEILSTYGAAVVSRYDRRLYFEDGIAPHVVGYVSAIQEDEINEYRRKGYRSDARVGRKGLELWGESTLAGDPGGALYLFNPEGKPIGDLGSAPSQPGHAIYATLERDFQYEAQKAMSVFSGAIVVLERDTGRVLAMVSTPGFDPNAYEIENYNWNTLLDEILNNPDSPQYNRAAQGLYPLGSVFKLVTMAAALESGRYTQETTYQCEYVFEELAGFPRYDWTWDHYQEDGITRPSGLLTLPEGLIRSCNPYFWHIGLDLYNAGMNTLISGMSRGFGLGSLTGIEVIDEEAGLIPDPQSEVDAINLAIGQGDMQVTPLQVARLVAAIGNGGTLYRPQLIEAIVPPGSAITSTYVVDAQDTLPIKPENLEIIQEAMKGVVRNEIPAGTALRAFRGLEVNVAGKTGTATAPTGEPHAWFAGYTFEERPDRPDIAVAVIAENAGEGSEIAAPIFRRIVELYFYGKPLKLYRWEANFDVTRSPTPILTETPTPEPGAIP
jgi:penicillin-binding protein 2